MENHNLKISVITIIEQNCKKLNKTINSVRRQCYPSIEYIIIDNFDILSKKQFKTFDNEIVVTGEALSYKEGLQIGLKKSSGDIILILNSNEYLLPKVFDSVVPFFKTGFDIVVGNWLCQDYKKSKKKVIIPKIDDDSLQEFWNENMHFNCSLAYFFSSSLKDNFPFSNYASLNNRTFLLFNTLRSNIKKVEKSFGVRISNQKKDEAFHEDLLEFWTLKIWGKFVDIVKSQLNSKDYRKYSARVSIELQMKRQRQINFLINSPHLDNLIKNQKLIPFPSSCYTYQHHNIKSYPRVIPFCEYYFLGDQIIDVHQVGKVASFSVVLSLKDRGIAPVHHTHRLGSAIWDEVIKKSNTSATQYFKAFSQVFCNYKNDFYWKFITIIRDPIAIAISLYFQLLSDKIIIKERFEDEYIDIEEIKLQIKRIIEGYVLPYWENEFNKSGIIDIYNYEFDKEKEFTIIENSNLQVLIMKYESINSVFPIAIDEFLGIPKVSLFKENVTEKKSIYISDRYNLVKNNLKFEEKYLDIIYSHRFVTHFYKHNEIREMYEKWKK